ARLALDPRVAREGEELGQEAVELGDLAPQALGEARRVVPAALPLDELREPGDRAERVPDLVREPGREPSDRGEPLVPGRRAPEPLELGAVVDERRGAQDLARLRILERRGRELDEPGAAL